MGNWQNKISLFLCCLGAAWLLLIPLAGCGDMEGTSGGIEVMPSKVTVGIDQPQFFQALGRDSSGKLIAVNPTWTVQGDIGTIKSSGLFEAGSVEGTGSVTATDGAMTGSAAITITIKGWLTGNVTDTNGGQVVGIRVYLKELPALGAETNSTGTYLIPDIPAGVYEADIDARGATAAGSAEVTISQGQTTTQDFQLYTPTTVTTSTTSLF